MLAQASPRPPLVSAPGRRGDLGRTVMRARHLKKIALRRDTRPYRQARSRGSKALKRRWRAMQRHWRRAYRAVGLSDVRREMEQIVAAVRAFSRAATPGEASEGREGKGGGK
jgi:hypothetical protein